MSFLFISLALGSLSVMFPTSFSLVIDKIVAGYTLIAVIVLALYFRETKKVLAVDRTNKSYVFKKKSGEPLTLQQVQDRMASTWEKESRVGFRQFLLWTGELTGAQDYLAGARLDGDPQTAFIKYRDCNGKKDVCMWTEGFPNPGPSQWLTLGEDFKYYESDNGKIQDKGREKAYWDEASKSLIRVRESLRTKIVVTQIRQLVDEDTLVATMKAKKMDNHPTKDDKPENEFSMTYKFKGPTTPEPPPYVQKGNA